MTRLILGKTIRRMERIWDYKYCMYPLHLHWLSDNDHIQALFARSFSQPIGWLLDLNRACSAKCPRSFYRHLNHICMYVCICLTLAQPPCDVCRSTNKTRVMGCRFFVPQRKVVETCSENAKRNKKSKWFIRSVSRRTSRRARVGVSKNISHRNWTR